MDTSQDKNKPTLSGQIANMLREEILSGTYKPGDVLPSEREVAAKLNVSRIPVREAMKSLEYLGIVKQSRGNGMVVQAADLSNILRVVGPLVTTMTPEMVQNLFDFRLLIEPFAAKQAAYHATPEALEDIARKLENHALAIQNNEPVEEISFEFHLSVMQASNNEVISIVNNFLSELQRYSRHWTVWNDERRRQAYEGHKRIFEAIAAHDGELAQQVMFAHLVDAKGVLTKAPDARSTQKV